MIDGEVLRRADSLPEMLLKYLAVVGGPCGVDSAARFLWPEQTLALARARLRNVLVRTKERFGPAVVRRAGLLMLGAHVSVDAFRLRELEGLLAAGRPVDEATLMDCFQAYRGHLLAGEEGGWLEPPRQALLMCHLRILDGLADFAARRGDAVQEARWIEEAYRLAPYDDGRIIRLVRVLSRAGYHARARRAFELGCDVLTELGVRLPPQLLELAH
jgi:DNA-binding SARP family transcriptional activator